MANGGNGSKWDLRATLTALSILVIFAGLVASYTTTQAGVSQNARDIEKKADKEVIEVKLENLQRTVDEIKTEIRAMRSEK